MLLMTHVACVRTCTAMRTCPKLPVPITRPSSKSLSCVGMCSACTNQQHDNYSLYQIVVAMKFSCKNPTCCCKHSYMQQLMQERTSKCTGPSHAPHCSVPTWRIAVRRSSCSSTGLSAVAVIAARCCTACCFAGCTAASTADPASWPGAAFEAPSPSTPPPCSIFTAVLLVPFASCWK